jgi:hypothetical protein
MPIDKIKEIIGNQGVRSYYYRYNAVVKYLKWLYNNENDQKLKETIIEKYYEVKQLGNNSIPYVEVYLYDFSDLKMSLETNLRKASADEFADYSGLEVYYLLQWHGVTTEEFISIKLSDVSENKVYIPLSNRTITVNDWTAEKIKNYKNESGTEMPAGKNYKMGFIYYKQDTLFRTIRSNDITIKTIYNYKHKFVNSCGDERFAKKRVYYSGRYFELIKLEQKLNIELDIKNAELMYDIMPELKCKESQAVTRMLRDYALFKVGYYKKNNSQYAKKNEFLL